MKRENRDWSNPENRKRFIQQLESELGDKLSYHDATTGTTRPYNLARHIEQRLFGY